LRRLAVIEKTFDALPVDETRRAEVRAAEIPAGADRAMRH
jgi:hypothetical protein